MKLQLIMPMAGEARRFNSDSTKLVIKPLLEVRSKNLYQWALSSLEGLDLEIIFIIKAEHAELREDIRKNFPAASIVELSTSTNGPGETLSFSLPHLRMDMPTIVCDCDLYFESDAFREFLKTENKSVSTGVLTFSSQNPAYSYVQLDGDRITDIKEKVVISGNAVCGCYYFSHGSVLASILKEELKATRPGEFYLSDLIKASLKRNLTSKAFPCDKHVSLGTPQEITQNQNLLPSDL